MSLNLREVKCDSLSPSYPEKPFAWNVLSLSFTEVKIQIMYNIWEQLEDFTNMFYWHKWTHDASSVNSISDAQNNVLLKNSYWTSSHFDDILNCKYLILELFITSEIKIWTLNDCREFFFSSNEANIYSKYV